MDAAIGVCLDAAEAFEDSAQPLGRHVKDFEVRVRRIVSEQMVAHPAADDERASAGVADGFGDRGHGSCSHRMQNIARRR